MEHDAKGDGPNSDGRVDEWLSALADDSEGQTISFSFPSDAIKRAYLDSVPARTEAEVRIVLRHFLMDTGELGVDELRLQWLEHVSIHDPAAFDAAMKADYYRRLAGIDPAGEPTWQGLSWILDLLPRWPMQAIEVLESYFLAHMMCLPDGRISGISDAQALIRAMWIGNPASGAQKRELVFQLGPQRFEHLVESLYAAMGFDTHITARSGDGGRDIEIERSVPGARERSLIECKLWNGPIGVRTVRPLLGVVAHELATKGILVSGGTFTKPARELASHDPRLELLGWNELLCLLDQHLGADWGRNVDRYIAESMRRTGFADD